MLHYLILVFTFCCASFNSHAANKVECLTHHCVGVIDAGSSGSRFHIYSYDLDASKTPIQIKEIWSNSISPGISTIKPEPKISALYLEKLLKNAPQAHIPVYFYSTAGMRLLSKSRNNQIYQLVREWFAHQDNWRLLDARTISGQEEGIFAWLSVNYQLNLLKPSKKPSVGIMDVGGASVQIVIPVKNKVLSNSKDVFSIQLYGQSYRLFSYSFLGLGQNEFNKGNLTLKSCYPVGYPLPQGRIGQGAIKKCISNMTKRLNRTYSVTKIIKPIVSSNTIDDWYLMGGITHIFTSKIFSLTQRGFTGNELLLLADKNICKQKWVVLNTSYPEDSMKTPTFCMLSAYLYSLTSNGYGIKPSKEIHLIPSNMNGDWSLGVVLQHH